MGDNRNKNKERIPMDLAPNPVLKVEPPRNSPGPALLRTVPLASHQNRFLPTNIQASTSTSSPSINKQGNVQRIESLPGGSGAGTTAVINRLQASTTSSYHIPRGAAAVANIAVPRSSLGLATPIMRGTYSVAASTNQPTFLKAASPAVTMSNRVTWLGVNTTQPQRHPFNPRQVNSRTAPSCGTTTVSTRQVLLQAKPQKPQVHLSEKIVQKGAVLVGPRGPGRVSRLAPPLRPVVLPASATAVLVSAHSNTLQLQPQPAPITINTRPVSGPNSTVRMTAAETGVVSKVYCTASEPVYLQTAHKPAHGGNVVSIPNSLYSLPANSFYDSSSSYGTFTTTPVTSTSIHQTRQSTGQVQGVVATGQPLRFTSPLVVVDQSGHPYVPPDGGQSLQPSETSSNAVSIKTNASPRPSILRKREPEGSTGKAAKNLNPLFTTLSVATPSSPPSPPSRGNGGAQSSGGSTTISATSSPGLGTDSPPLKVDEDRPVEMSPRKKPRKQQLTGNQMQEPKFSDEEMEFIPSGKLKKPSKEGVLRDRILKSVSKRPALSLMRNYRPSWKAKHHHFLRHSDVKVKEEKRTTLADIALQKNVLQKVNGWKIYHLVAQMTTISNFEIDVFEKLTVMLKELEKKSGKDGDLNRANELIKGNIQRKKVISDQLEEAKCQVLKLVDHKCQVIEMLNCYSSRRSGKKRERV